MNVEEATENSLRLTSVLRVMTFACSLVSIGLACEPTEALHFTDAIELRCAGPVLPSACFRWQAQQTKAVEEDSTDGNKLDKSATRVLLMAAADRYKYMGDLEELRGQNAELNSTKKSFSRQECRKYLKWEADGYISKVGFRSLDILAPG